MAARRGNPVVVLVVFATVVALVLGLVWQFADGRSTSAADAPTDSVAPSADPSLNTPVLSFRRAPGVLSRSVNLDAFAAELEPLVAAIPDGSCLAVAVDGQTVATKNESFSVVPASNQKLLVGAVALDELGADHRFSTTVTGEFDAATGTVNGDLFLIGGGDPVLSSDWWTTSGVQTFPPTVTTRIEDLADDVVAAGVTNITGRVVGDGSRYDDEWYVPSWMSDVPVAEAGPYDALLVNDSRPTSTTVADDPAQGAADVLSQLLAERGVTIGGDPASGAASSTAEIAAIESEPLAAILGEMLTTSDNNTAEMLVKEIGLSTSGRPTRNDGLAAIQARLQEWGVPTGGLVLADGSGLSNDNRLTCSTLLGVLQHGSVDDAVGEGLAVGATTGTLRNTFEDTEMAGLLRGKTGTLNNDDNILPAVKALSGYVPVEGGGAIEYALVLNGQTVSNQSVYEPIWYDLMSPAFATYPAAGSIADLAPR